MKKKIIKFFIILMSEIILAAACIFGTYRYMFHNSKYYDPLKYKEKLLEIDLKAYTEEADGYIILDDAEYAVVKMRVIKGCEEDVLNLFDDKLGEALTPDSPPIAFPHVYYETEINQKKSPVYV